MPGVIRSWPPLPTITQIPPPPSNCPALVLAGCVHCPLASPLSWPLSAPEAASPRLLLTSHRAHCALEAGHWSPGGQVPARAQEKQVHCEHRSGDRVTHHTSPQSSNVTREDQVSSMFQWRSLTSICEHLGAIHTCIHEID